MRKWSKVTVKNNWETLEYSLDGKKFESSFIQSADVRYPDGTIEEKKEIWHKRRNTPIYDMGHEYIVSTEELMIYSLCHGIKVAVDLFKVEIDKSSVIWRPCERTKT